MTLTHVPTEATLAHEVIWARSFSSRARGLIGRSLAPGRALVIEPAKQVHTFFMTFSIDVVFCDADWRVRHVVHRMQPFRVTKLVASARRVIELPAGMAADVRPGDALRI